MDRIDTMKIFVRVAEVGGFTKASDALGVPRATVSAAVQQLESRLGARLFQRTTRRVHLTRDGEALLERCREVLSDVDEIEGLFRQTPARIAGKLKVDMPSRLSRRVVAPALPVFFDRYPDIELELGVSDRPVDLIQEGVDCAVRAGRLGDSSLVARPLGEIALINCASPTYLAKHGVPRAPDDLAAHWAVNYVSSASGRAAVWDYVEQGERHALTMRSRVAVNNAETYIACCLAGLGLIQIPAYDVRQHLAVGDLVEVMPQARVESMPLYVLYPHRRHLSRRVQVFIEWLQEVLLANL